MSEPAWLAVQIAVARRPGLTVSDRFEALNNGMRLTTQELTASFDGRQHLIRAAPGELVITYDAALSRSAPAAVEPVTQLQRIVALRPSRYCPADRMVGFARSHFGGLPRGRRSGAGDLRVHLPAHPVRDRRERHRHRRRGHPADRARSLP